MIVKPLFRYLVLSLVITSFNCCHERIEDIGVDCQNVVEAPGDFKDYFIFNEGSWWKYNLSGTNDTDIRTVVSLTKVSYDVKASVNFGIPPCVYQYTCMTDHTHSSFKNLWQGYGDSYKLKPNGDSLHWIISHTNQSNYYSLEIFSIWPIQNKYSNGFHMIDSLDAKISLNGNTIECLKIKKITVNISDSNFIGEAYFSKNIGLVKYTILPNKTWILDKYSIK